MSEERVVKCLVVGDGYVGKTCLLQRLARKTITEVSYVPTIFDNTSIVEQHLGSEYKVHLIDTAGQEEYSAIRVLSYDQVDVFLVCFSVENSTSFANVQDSWLSEVRRGNKTASIILVGTKSDLRDNPETIDRLNMSGDKAISTETARSYAKEEKIPYIECSAVKGDNIDELRKLMLDIYVRQHQQQSRCAFPPICCSSISKVLCCRRYT